MKAPYEVTVHDYNDACWLLDDLARREIDRSLRLGEAYAITYDEPPTYRERGRATPFGVIPYCMRCDRRLVDGDGGDIDHCGACVGP